MSSSISYEGTDNLEVMAAARRYNAFLAGLINRYAPSNGTILDFGAGMGNYTATTFTPDRKIICIEPDTNFRTALKARGYEAHVSLDSVADASCDFVYSLNVLEHIQDDGAAARELFRVMKPESRALIYVPAFQALYSGMDKKVGHFRRYDLGMLKSVLGNAGFTIETARYADSLGFFAALAYKWFGNDDGSLNMRGLVLYDRIIFPISRLLDVVAHPFFGKNAVALVRKPSGR